MTKPSHYIVTYFLDAASCGHLHDTIEDAIDCAFGIKAKFPTSSPKPQIVKQCGTSTVPLTPEENHRAQEYVRKVIS